MSIEDKIKDNHCRCSCDPDNEVRGTDIDVGLPRSAEIYGMKLGLEAWGFQFLLVWNSEGNRELTMRANDRKYSGGKC